MTKVFSKLEIDSLQSRLTSVLAVLSNAETILGKTRTKYQQTAYELRNHARNEIAKVRDELRRAVD